MFAYIDVIVYCDCINWKSSNTQNVHDYKIHPAENNHL